MLILEGAQSMLGKRGGASRLRQLGYELDSLPATLLAPEGPVVLVARFDDAISGFATISIDEARLEMIFVDPARRRRGIGSALVRAAAEHIRQRSEIPLSVIVAAGNRGEKSLFEALGYRAELLLMELRDPKGSSAS